VILRFYSPVNLSRFLVLERCQHSQDSELCNFSSRRSSTKSVCGRTTLLSAIVRIMMLDLVNH
jgi:hypothetical protein